MPSEETKDGGHEPRELSADHPERPFAPRITGNQMSCAGRFSDLANVYW